MDRYLCHYILYVRNGRSLSDDSITLSPLFPVTVMSHNSFFDTPYMFNEPLVCPPLSNDFRPTSSRQSPRR